MPPPAYADKISDFQNFACQNQIFGLQPGRPVPSEGRFAIVTNAGRDAVDAAAPLTNGANADGEVVWS